MAENDGAQMHSILLEEREKLRVTGVSDVQSFDEEQVLLETGKGMLIVRGQGLHVEKLQLDAGETVVRGEISLLEYDDSVPPRGGVLRMMTADINREQLILLAQCVLFGAGAGLCYDVFRAARRVLCPGRAGETACDALFCMLMLAAAFRFAIVNAAGQWRLFVLLGACAGGALWQVCLSAAALPLFLGAAGALRAAAHRAGRGVQWCFQWASAEKIREIRKKVCKTPFHFSRKRYKIKSKSVQRQER